VQPICGGAIIRALTATDNVGILSYKVYVNGSPAEVPLASLQASTLTSISSHRTFSGILVLSLASYAGKTANITITAVDYGANEGPGLSRVISVPEGTWYPVVLYPKWNLVSLPLIPNSTSTADICSLILKQGAAGVTVTYGFDNTAKAWIMDPAHHDRWKRLLDLHESLRRPNSARTSNTNTASTADDVSLDKGMEPCRIHRNSIHECKRLRRKP